MESLNITEIFHSVQGETSFTGLPTTFIRLAACNLRCTWCDTPYSFGRGDPTPLDEIVTQVNRNGSRHVCITGGEPLLQSEIHPLIRLLCDSGYVVSLETGGSLPIDCVDPGAHIILDIKCPGSGMSHKNLWDNIGYLQKKDEVKFVIQDRADYEYAKAICKKHALDEACGQVLFSPVHNVLDSQKLVSWILQDRLKVRLNLQMHKFIWNPETRGV